MSLPPRFPPDARGDLWRQLARAQDSALGAAADRTTLARGARGMRGDQGARPATHASGHSLRARLRGGVAVIGLAASVTLVVGLVARRAPLSFQLGRTGQPGVPGAAVFTDARSDLPLQFSDGSMITFRAGSAGRMQRLTTAGAEVALDRGVLDAHVVHTESTLWLVHAGPFQVRVTGTRFTVGWSPPNLNVTVYEGAVLVGGAPLGAGVPVVAGHRLTIENGVVRTEALQAIAPTASADAIAVSTGTTGAGADGEPGSRERPIAHIGGPAPATRVVAASSAGAQAPGIAAGATADDDDSRAARAGELGAVAARATDGASARAGAAAPAGSLPSIAAAPGIAATPSASRESDWLQLAQRGAYHEALAAAKRVGWRGLCGRLDARRLLMLGDVARYAGARDEARQAFEALATRFPNDRLAADAVFSLGRLAFEAEHPAEASRWFGRYVDDWPNAPLGDQAIGRQMECARQLGDDLAARRAAEAYLARAPDGPHASLARDVLGQSSAARP